MKKHLLIKIFILFVAMGLSHQAQTKEYINSSAITTVTGKLRTKLMFGPPGFGETPRSDSRVRIYFIELQPNLTPKQLRLAPGGGEEPRKSYGKIQLWCGEKFAKCEIFLRAHLNKVILASGIAAYALEANDFLPVTMTVGALDEN